MKSIGYLKHYLIKNVRLEKQAKSGIRNGSVHKKKKPAIINWP